MTKEELALSELSPQMQLAHRIARAITAQDPALVPEAFLNAGDMSGGRGRLAGIAQNVGPLCVPPRSFMEVMQEGGALIAQARGEQTPPL